MAVTAPVRRRVRLPRRAFWAAVGCTRNPCAEQGCVVHPLLASRRDRARDAVGARDAFARGVRFGVAECRRAAEASGGYCAGKEEGSSAAAFRSSAVGARGTLAPSKVMSCTPL